MGDCEKSLGVNPHSVLLKVLLQCNEDRRQTDLDMATPDHQEQHHLHDHQDFEHASNDVVATPSSLSTNTSSSSTSSSSPGGSGGGLGSARRALDDARSVLRRLWQTVQDEATSNDKADANIAKGEAVGLTPHQRTMLATSQVGRVLRAPQLAAVITPLDTNLALGPVPPESPLGLRLRFSALAHQCLLNVANALVRVEREAKLAVELRRKKRGSSGDESTGTAASATGSPDGHLTADIIRAASAHVISHLPVNLRAQASHDEQVQSSDQGMLLSLQEHAYARGLLEAIFAWSFDPLFPLNIRHVIQQSAGSTTTKQDSSTRSGVVPRWRASKIASFPLDLALDAEFWTHGPDMFDRDALKSLLTASLARIEALRRSHVEFRDIVESRHFSAILTSVLCSLDTNAALSFFEALRSSASSYLLGEALFLLINLPVPLPTAVPTTDRRWRVHPTAFRSAVGEQLTNLLCVKERSAGFRTLCDLLVKQEQRGGFRPTPDALSQLSRLASVVTTAPATVDKGKYFENIAQQLLDVISDACSSTSTVGVNSVDGALPFTRHVTCALICFGTLCTQLQDGSMIKSLVTLFSTPDKRQILFKLLLMCMDERMSAVTFHGQLPMLPLMRYLVSSDAAWDSFLLAACREFAQALHFRVNRTIEVVSASKQDEIWIHDVPVLLRNSIDISHRDCKAYFDRFARFFGQILEGQVDLRIDAEPLTVEWSQTIAQVLCKILVPDNQISEGRSKIAAQLFITAVGSYVDAPGGEGVTPDHPAPRQLAVFFLAELLKDQAEDSASTLVQSVISSCDFVEYASLCNALLRQSSSEVTAAAEGATDASFRDTIDLSIRLIAYLIQSDALVSKVSESSKFLLVDTSLLLESLLENVERLSVVDASLTSMIAEVLTKVSSVLLSSDRQSNEPSDPPEQPSVDEFSKILDILRHPLLPVRAHGLIELRAYARRLVSTIDQRFSARQLGPGDLCDVGRLQSSKARDQELDQIASIFRNQLRDEDSYVFLAAIEGVSAVIDVDADRFLPLVTDLFVSSTATSLENRLKAGEVLNHAIRRFGKTVGRHTPVLVDPCLRVCAEYDQKLSSDDQLGIGMVVASALSNLAQICKQLEGAVVTVADAVLPTVHSLLVMTDPSRDTRSSAPETGLIVVRRACCYLCINLFKAVSFTSNPGRELVDLLRGSSEARSCLDSLQAIVERPVSEDEIVVHHATVATQVILEVVGQKTLL